MIRFFAQVLVTLIVSGATIALTGPIYLIVATIIGASCGLILLSAKRETIREYAKSFLCAVFLGLFWPALPLIIIWGDAARAVTPERESRAASDSDVSG